MFEGMYVEKVLTHKYIRPYPQQPQETAGYNIGSQAIYRYSLKDFEYPALIIPDPIYDGSGGIIKPGHYEVALSDSMEFLILLESKKPIAIIPVIKVEEDATEKVRLNNKKVKKELKKEKKLREDTNKKRAKTGMPPDEPKIFAEASLEFVPDGEYYLIKYQKGTIKAWGAFKG